MTKKLVEPMSESQIAELSAPGKYYVGGVAGLMLNIKKDGSRSWCARFQVSGEKREITIGCCASMSRADACSRVNEIRDRIQVMAYRAEESAFIEESPESLSARKLKNESRDAPWMRIVRQDSEALGHALAARILELSEPAITRAIREAAWVAMEEIKEAGNAA